MEDMPERWMDLEKKMTKIALSLHFTKVKEEKKWQKIQGVAMITLMSGNKEIINNVGCVQWVFVLFHGGEQLLLTLEGKGRNGMRVEAE